MAILGTVISDIDQAAHLGGFATGFVGGFFLSRPCPVISGRWLIVRHVVMVVMVAGALTITAAAITLRAQSILPPVVRLRDLQEQIKPAVEEFQSIGAQFPSISALERQHATPASRTAGTQPIAVLIERGTANRARLLRVSTPDPGLKTIVANLIEAQSEQIRRLHAARRFLDGEGNDDLSGPNGVRMGRSATIQAIRAFQDQKRRYLSEPHALTDQNKPR
jgi:rhomboid protease GluP